MMAKSKEWETQMYVFPNSDGEYEHDRPYEVQYKSSGERRTVLLNQEQVNEIRKANALPPELITNEEGEELDVESN